MNELHGFGPLLPPVVEASVNVYDLLYSESPVSSSALLNNSSSSSTNDHIMNRQTQRHSYSASKGSRVVGDETTTASTRISSNSSSCCESNPSSSSSASSTSSAAYAAPPDQRKNVNKFQTFSVRKIEKLMVNTTPQTSRLPLSTMAVSSSGPPPSLALFGDSQNQQGHSKARNSTLVTPTYIKLGAQAHASVNSSTSRASYFTTSGGGGKGLPIKQVFNM